MANPARTDATAALAQVLELSDSKPKTEPAPTDRQLPPYVDHGDNVPEIGRITAAAVIMDFEATAIKFNDLSEQIKNVAQRCEVYMGELREITEHLDTVAMESRQRASVIFHALEESSKITANVRTQADELFKQVINTPIMRGE